MNNQAFDKFVQDQLSRIRESYENGTASSFGEATLLCRKDEAGTSFAEDAPHGLMIVMPGLGDQEICYNVREVAWKNDAFAAVVKLEMWFVQIPEDADAKLRAKLQKAKDAGKLDKLKPPLRREKVEVFLECEGQPLKVFGAEIVRKDDKTSLAPWEEAAITLPRPNFRRYLPETRDGKKTLVLPVGGMNIVLTKGN